MATVLEIINRISFLAAMPSVVGLLAALALLLVARRWQMHSLGMAALYFFAALLHTRVIRPEVALVKLIIGWMIALALYMTGRHLSGLQEGPGGEGEAVEGERPRFSLAAGAPLRILVLVAVFIIAQGISRRFSLPQVPGDVGLACYLLGTGGLFLMGLSEDPFRAGLGVLTFLAGFDLLFGALEPSLVVAGLIGVADFLVALAVTFLAVTHAGQWEGER